MPRWLVLGMLVFLVGFGRAGAASRLFSYYSPLSVRSFGMGGAGSADLADQSNVAANPATVSFLDGATASFLYAPLSTPPLDFDYTSTFIALGADARIGASTVLNGVIGSAYRRERIEVSVPGVDEVSDNIYHAFVGGGVESRQIRIGVGIGAKWYPVGLSTGEEEDVSLIDIGAVSDVRVMAYGGTSFRMAAGYSRMNIGEPVVDPLLGSIDAPEMDRFGLMIACNNTTGTCGGRTRESGVWGDRELRHRDGSRIFVR